MGKRAFLNTYINNLSVEEALQAIEHRIESGGRSYLVEINADVVLKFESDAYLKQITDNADLVLVDGQPLVWIARLFGQPIKAKISGADLMPMLCQRAAQKGYTVFILGGMDGVAERAKTNLERDMPGLRVVGTYSPPLGFEKDEEELARINARISQAHPDMLFACMGCPKQEKWIYENYQKYDARISLCAGASVDFIAGSVKRAPQWMSRCGLEWFYRFLQEPKRLFKRYFIDDVKIIFLAWRYRRETRSAHEFKAPHEI